MSPASNVPFVLAGDNCMCQQSVLHVPSQIVCDLVMSEHSFFDISSWRTIFAVAFVSDSCVGQYA
jgi:hypothetical protein